MSVSLVFRRIEWGETDSFTWAPLPPATEDIFWWWASWYCLWGEVRWSAVLGTAWGGPCSGVKSLAALHLLCWARLGCSSFEKSREAPMLMLCCCFTWWAKEGFFSSKIESCFRSPSFLWDKCLQGGLKVQIWHLPWAWASLFLRLWLSW